jgi:hypothetical protein
MKTLSNEEIETLVSPIDRLWDALVTAQHWRTKLYETNESEDLSDEGKAQLEPLINGGF